MQEPAKSFWPDKSQFASDFKDLTDRRSGRKTKNLPLAVDERRDRHFDNSIRKPASEDIRLGPKAHFSDEELKRQCEAQSAKASASLDILLSSVAPGVTPVKLSDEAIASVAVDFSSPPWED
ncbi:hypothetical protein [Undibacterium sp.]|uniref:hypothetical protein n=1 Tax=Undibacterium sp. TaxID=1914977 RepID=UPI00374D3726